MRLADTPSDQELEAWRLFLRTHATVVRRLEAELLADQQLPLASYDVLVQLGKAPGQRLRMTDIADRVVLSRSGVTRLVDRLEREGLVCRQACPSDARGTYTVLTPAGLDRLRRAAPVHLRGVGRLFTSRLSATDSAELSALLRKVLGPGDCSEPAEEPGSAG